MKVKIKKIQNVTIRKLNENNTRNKVFNRLSSKAKCD